MKIAITKKIAIITKGSKGADLIDKNEIISILGEKVKVVDTTGAGDMFSATFTYGLMKNMTKKDALRESNKAAAEHIKYMGPKRKI